MNEDNQSDWSADADESQSSGQTIALPAAAKGEKGEGGATPAPAIHVSNAEFMRVALKSIPEGALSVVCSKAGDPTQGGWHAEPAGAVDEQCPSNRNNYFNCSSFAPNADTKVTAQKIQFHSGPVSMARSLKKNGNPVVRDDGTWSLKKYRWVQGMSGECDSGGGTAYAARTLADDLGTYPTYQTMIDKDIALMQQQYP